MLIDALETGDDDNASLVQVCPDPGIVDVADTRFRMGRVSQNPYLCTCV